MPDSEPSTPASLAASAASIGAAIGRYRWVICALLFGATTINYVDRQVIGILKNELQRSIGWNEQAYGNIVAAFQAAYAIGLLLVAIYLAADVGSIGGGWLSSALIERGWSVNAGRNRRLRLPDRSPADPATGAAARARTPGRASEHERLKRPGTHLPGRSVVSPVLSVKFLAELGEFP